MPALSQVVVMTIFDDKVGVMTTLGFQCMQYPQLLFCCVLLFLYHRRP